MSSLNRKILIGTIWSLTGQVGTMAITLIANIILARSLSPKEFGQVGIIMFFIAIATVLTESGLGGALIRKKEVNKSDFSTVFIFNLAISVFSYVILWLISDWIVGFYGNSTLKPLLLVSGIILFINSFNITQNVLLIRNMDFKSRSLFRFVATLVSSIVGIICAFNGAGVWSLVYIQLLTASLFTIFLIFKSGFFFSLKFDSSSFKSLYSFGVNTTLASLLNTAFENIYQLIIGKAFSINQVGLFYQAKKTQDVPSGIINLTTQNVLFSSLSKLQDDKLMFVTTYNRIIRMFTTFMGIITSFFVLYSKEVIFLLYGEKWLGAAYFMVLLSIASFFYLQEMFNRIIFKVFNETRKILYLEFAKKGIQSLSIVVGLISKDINILLVGFVLTSVISYLINFYYSRKVLGDVLWFELIVLVKIVFAAGCCILLSHIVNSSLDLHGNFKFLSFIAFLLSYGFAVYYFKILDVIKEGKAILKLYKS